MDISNYKKSVCALFVCIVLTSINAFSSPLKIDAINNTLAKKDSISTSVKKDVNKESSKESVWEEFSFKNSFSISMPAKPTHSKQTIELPGDNLKILYDTYVSEPDVNSVYIISVWQYPTKIDVSKPERNLQDGFNGMMAALPQSQIVSMKSGEIQGFKSLEFWVKNDDVFFRGILVSVNHSLYQVFMVYKIEEEKAMEVNYSKFLNSFKLMPTQSKQTISSNKKKILF